jgi:hypothetical protein
MNSRDPLLIGRHGYFRALRHDMNALDVALPSFNMLSVRRDGRDRAIIALIAVIALGSAFGSF